MIPSRFTNNFILDSLKFILTNNNFLFDDKMFHQLSGTAMGTKCAPPFACLVIGYMEENLLFPIELPKYFSDEECQIIKKYFKRYMDDCFIIWPSHLSFHNFIKCLNNMHPSIQYTFEKAKIVNNDIHSFTKVLNFLDVKIILHENGNIDTDIYYKDTNPHDYLPFDSAHPDHIKNNIPFNLAKRIIVFVSDKKIMDERLKELKLYLLKCGYPINIISKAFHNAKLQGPSPKPQKEELIPYVTTFHQNIDNNLLVNSINQKISSIRSPNLKNVFQNSNIILSQRQPKNILQILTKSTFLSNKLFLPNGVFKCNDIRCKICNLYLVECSSFQMSNGEKWEIRSNINCHSRNVIYYLKCNMCNDATTYIGKTEGDINKGFKPRMNNHISESRTGKSYCNFPKHVYNCGIKNNCLIEPFFKIFIMMRLSDSSRLETYEKHFQRKGCDTMNS